jgi:hypothetical protein
LNFRVTGFQAQQVGGTLEIEIGGMAEGTQYDLVNVLGNAALGGNLEPSMLNGFVPNAANAFTIFQATGSITGVLANVANGQRLSTSDGPGSFVVNYGPGSAFNSKLIVLSALQAVQLPGDYNENGTVDAADYTLWCNTLGQSGAGLSADGNGNNQIDAARLAPKMDPFCNGLPVSNERLWHFAFVVNPNRRRASCEKTSWHSRTVRH